MCIRGKERIDTSTAVNYEQMYAQAIGEIKSGERIYFDNEAEYQIQLNNADFLQID